MIPPSSIFEFAASAGQKRIWLYGSLTFVLLWALPNLSFPIGRDQALYCVIADGVLNGQRPYVDLWDNRPPTTFLVFLPIVKIFGRAVWSMGATDIVWLLGMSYFVFWFAERYMGAPAAALAVGVHAVWHSVAGYTHALVPSTFVIFFVFAGFFLVWKDSPRTRLRHFASGVMMALAFWATYNALLFLPLLLILPYTDFSGLDNKPRSVKLTISYRDWWPRAASLAAGWFAASFVLVAYLWFVGSWEEFYHINFAVMPEYARLPLERTGEYALWSVMQTEYVVGRATLVVLFGALLTATYSRELRILTPVVLASALGFISAAMQIRFHDYYFETAYPFFAMGWGYMGVWAFESFRRLAKACRAKGWRVASPLVWGIFANIVAWFAVDFAFATHARFKVLADWWRDPVTAYAAYPWPHTLEHLKGEFGVIRFLGAESSPEDKVFVWGTQPIIYFLSERKFPTRFVSNLGLISPWGPRAWQEELVRDLRKSPPKFIIVVRKDAIPSVSYTPQDSEQFLEIFPELDGFIRGSYERERTIENFVVYRRRAAKS